IDNNSDSKTFIRDLIDQRPIGGLRALEHKQGLLFSRSKIDRYMEEEQLHDIKVLTKGKPQSLMSMSSGEQKKALLAHLLEQRPDILSSVNPFGKLDLEAKSYLRDELECIGSARILVHLLSRVGDVLLGTTDFFFLQGDTLQKYPSEE